MFNVLALPNLCEDISILKLVLIIKNVINIGKISVPLILIIMAIIDINKGYIIDAGKDKNKVNNVVFKRLLAALIVFFIPTFIEIVVSSLGNMKGSLNECMSVTNDSLDLLRQSAKDICASKEDYFWNELNNECVISANISYSTNNSIIRNNIANKKVTNLVYYAQRDYKNTLFCRGSYNVANNGCGVASFAMIASSYSNSSYDPTYVANTLCQKHCPNCGSGGLPVKILYNDDYYKDLGLNHTKLFHNGGYETNGYYSKKYNSSEGTKILNAVQSGKSVLLLIPNHYVVLGPNTSCTSEQVYYYDPDWHSKNGCYTPSEIYSFTYNYSSRCTKNNWCGWHLAIAMD